MPPIPEAAIKVAAKWWRNAVADVKFDNGGVGSGPVGPVAALVTMNVQHEKEVLDKFEANLIELLSCTSPDFDGRVTLRVDYHPDQLLAACWPHEPGTEVGVGVFPWKTHMRISPSEVYVRHGYGADRQVIWSVA